MAGLVYRAQRVLDGLDLGVYPDVCMAFGLYEHDTEKQLRKLLAPGMHFVDCGANVGYFSMIAAKIVGEAGRVDAFEPDPVNLQRLRMHLRRNNLDDHVSVHAVGVADRSAEVTLYHPVQGTNHGQASVFPALVKESQAFAISVVRLDQCLDQVPDVIKVDIEGGELLALQGMKEFLSAKAPPALVIEHNPETGLAAGWTPSSLYESLVAMQPRYKVYWIGRVLRRIRTAGALEKMHRHGNLLVTAD